jgi:hypothetical protein
MTCQRKYFRYVFTVGSYITAYYYSKIVRIKKHKITITVKNIIYETRMDKIKKILNLGIVCTMYF